MNILNVNTSIDPVRGGGTGERTVQMSKHLAKYGHRCTILTLDIGVTEKRKEELSDVKLHLIPLLNKRYYLPGFSILKIGKEIRNTDIVHLMGHWTLLNAIVFLFIKMYKKPFVVCPAGSLPVFGRSKKIKNIYNFVIGKRIIRDANLHFYVAENEIEHYAQYGVARDSMIWIPNAIDPTLLRLKDDALFRKRFNLTSDPYILFIGRLNLIKGPDLLMKAFIAVHNEFPNYHLVIAGPDEGMGTELAQMASDAEVRSRVHFIGSVSGNTKSYAYHASSLMVIPSRSEAMSIVVLEAGVAGLPVVLTDQCGLNYLQTIGAAEVVTCDSEAIAEGIRKILRNIDHLEHFGKKLHTHILESYTWESIIPKYVSAYNAISKNYL